MFVHEDFNTRSPGVKKEMINLLDTYKKLVLSQDQLAKQFEEKLKAFRQEIAVMMESGRPNENSTEKAEPVQFSIGKNNASDYLSDSAQESTFLCLHDHKFNVLHWAPGLLDTLGYECSEAEDLAMIDLIHPDDVKSVFKEYLLNHHNKFESQYILRIKKKDKTYLHLQTTIKQITGSFEFLKFFQSRSTILNN